MVSKVCLCFLTVIHIAAAFPFQTEVPSDVLSSFHAPSQNLFDTPTINKVGNAARAKEQQSRLQKVKERVEQQEERMGQLNESLTEQLSQVQDQMLAKMQASQLEQKSQMATIEKQLQHVEGRLDAFEKVSSELHAEKTDDTDLPASTVDNDKPNVKFTTLQDVGLSFVVITERVKQKKMEEHCAQLVDGGRMIVLDSKSKLDALKTYVANTSEKPSFYVGLRKRGDRHLWSTGEEIDKSFWCNLKGKGRKNTCGSVKIHQDRICIGAVRCTKGRIICEKPL